MSMSEKIDFYARLTERTYLEVKFLLENMPECDCGAAHWILDLEAPNIHEGFDLVVKCLACEYTYPVEKLREMVR